QENKKSSFFGKLLGFFYNHTEAIVKTVLVLTVVLCFAQSFIKELEVYKSVRFAMNPIEIMFIGVVHAVFNIVKVFIPFVIVCGIVKYIMIKSRKLKIEFVFGKNFKYELLLSFLVSFAFTILFYTDLLVLTKYSKQLAHSSIQIFVLFFASVLFTLSSMHGIVNGIEPIVTKIKK
ncbi:MAG: hypothetical protein IJ638_04160, partial [Alphaproteobacteria bacterium]|nr:hypothetical protein [Alphaproteobacteria bacterium]